MNIPRARRILWTIAAVIWLAVAAVAIAGMLAMSRISHAEPDAVFASDFEFRCGFGTDAPRQMSGDVSFISNPGRHYTQPLERFGQLFGFYFNCPGSTCEDWTPFPGTNTVPILRTRMDGYVALAFDTSGLNGETFGYQVVSTSNQVFSVTEWSISDRCGDFDPLSPWLAAHPQCHQYLTPKAGSMRWTIDTTSPNACPIGDDPSRQWWLNFRVLECETQGATCAVNVKNQKG